MQRYVCHICHEELGNPDNWEDGTRDCPKCGEMNIVPRYSKNNIAIVLSCDFCGTDWDNESPMVEGHRGSILCLPCLEEALEQRAAGDSQFKCNVCQQAEQPAEMLKWSKQDAVPSLGLNVGAVICNDCITQASGTFTKDKDIDWRAP